MIYLTPGADSEEYLTQLRLQNLEVIDAPAIMDMARRSGRPKLTRAGRLILRLLEPEGGVSV